jgi:short-subunit dehydrogenase
VTFPFVGIYGASEFAVEALTDSLRYEVSQLGVEVVEAIVKLVGQAKGSRAVRTVVGAPFGSDQANEDVAPVQSKAVEALGLSHLEKVA